MNNNKSDIEICLRYWGKSNDLKVSPKHILAVINSRLLNWYYLNRLVTNEDSTPQLKNFDLDNIPIAKSIFNCEIICRLVDEIINGKNCNIDTLRKERSLDFLIYKLYSLSFDEIKIIEPYFDLSEAEYNSIEI